MPVRYRRILPYAPALLAFVVALLVRGLYLWQVHDAVFFDMAIGDGRSYHDWGARIAAGDWMGDTVFYQAPAYPYFIGVVYAIFGQSVVALKIIQAVMGAASCALLAFAGQRFVNAKVGLITGLMLALYPPAIFHDGIVQKASLGLLLLCALLAVVASVQRRPARGGWLIMWLVAGVIAGLLAITRENATIFLPVLGVWALWQGWRRGMPDNRRAQAIGAVKLAALLTFGTLLVLLPVAMRNYAVGGEFHLTTSQLGPNFYIGNNAKADGVYTPLVFGGGDPLVERRDATRLAERDLGRSLTPGEVSDYWLDKALADIKSDPGNWLRLMGRKALLLVNATEMADTEAQQAYADHSWLLRGLGAGWHFGTLAALAAFGLIVRPPGRRTAIVIALALVYAAAVVGFYVMARYRFPLAPLLMLPAATGIVFAVRKLRHRDWRRPAIGTIAAVAVWLITAIPLTDADMMRALHHSNVGHVLLQQREDVDRAIAAYERALALKPALPKTHNALGIALARAGRFAEAGAAYHAAVELHPEYAEAWFNLGVAFERQNRPELALSQYRKAIALDDNLVEAHSNLGRLLARADQLPQAIEHYHKALAIDPDHAQTHNNLGIAYARLGQWNQAVHHFREALRIEPGYADAAANLDRATNAAAGDQAGDQ